MAEVEVPTVKPVDGANLLPALLGDGEVNREIPMMWWLWHARGGYEVAMRHGDYKMLATLLPQQKPGDFSDASQPKGWSVMKFIKEAELGRFELFNLAADRAETKNLATTDPERFEMLKKKMVALHGEIRAEGPVYELSHKKK